MSFVFPIIFIMKRILFKMEKHFRNKWFTIEGLEHVIKNEGLHFSLKKELLNLSLSRIVSIYIIKLISARKDMWPP